MAIFQQGNRLGRYTIEAQISATHRYECYRAASEGERFVIKVAAAENPHRTSIVSDLNVQAQFLAPGRCPVDRIAHYLEVLPVGGTSAIVMRYFEGRPLTQLLCDPDWIESARLEFLRQLAFTLDQLHEHGVGHRDVSDGNVLIDPVGLPVLIDFELASVLPVLDDRQISLVSGSRFYKSPEQWAGLPQDAAVDVFAFALLTAYVLGRRAPELESLEFVDLPSPPLWFPRGVSRSLLLALAGDPALRPRMCATVLDA